MGNLPESPRGRDVSWRPPIPLEPPFILGVLSLLGALEGSVSRCCGLQEALLLNVDLREG